MPDPALLVGTGPRNVLCLHGWFGNGRGWGPMVDSLDGDRIAGNPVPVLVLVGRHDPALGEEACRGTWLQHYPNARLEVLDNAGHYPMNETPVWLATRIEAFLREVMPER